MAQEPVYISEFVAENSGGFLDEDGAASDWIEISNSGSTSANLLGWHLTDDPTDLKKWTFPSMNIAANGFLVVFASGKDRSVSGTPLHANFNLGAGGDYLALVHPDGVTIASKFSPVYPTQHRGFSYGVPQNVGVNRLLTTNAAVKVLIPKDGTLALTWVNNTFDDGGWQNATNGVGYQTSVPGFAVRDFKTVVGVIVDTIDKAEAVIATPSQRAAAYAENSPVINYLNTGAGAHYGNDRTVPGFTIGVDQDDYVIEAVGTITIPSPGTWTFGVNSDDGFKLTIGTTIERCDCLRGPADTLQTFNFPAAGDYPLRLVAFERGGGSEVELFAAKGSFTAWGANFSLVGDTANGGLVVRSQPVAGGSGFFYTGIIRTDVQSEMFSKNPSAYIRIPFSVPSASTLASLTLSMRYDDGFVAYLNGTEIVRRNAPASPQFNSTATATHGVVAGEDISLSDQLGLIHDGNNLLAIQGLNDAANSSTFLIEAQLAEFMVTTVGTNYQYFAYPTPGAPNAVPPVGGFVSNINFSMARGFYDTNISVAISCSSSGANIYYTLNGSAPSPTNGLLYAAPLSLTNTTTLRAAAYKSGFYPSASETQTYIFLNDVTHQKERVAPGPSWPAPRGRGTGFQTYDYGMDSNVVNNPSVNATLISDLKSIPTFSVVMDLNDLFDPQTGFYANAQGDTIAWERPCSLELIHSDGSKGFHVNCGIRVRGGYSRSPDNPKHGLRIFFRDDYGKASLQFPLFGPDGDDNLQKFDIRTFQNYSWSFDGDSRFIGLRDVFSRDTQLAMGQPGTRGNFFHLYINGAYWGIYNTDERAEANFAAFYFGGSSTNYDTIKVSPDDGYIVYATDGDMGAWTRLWMQATNGLSSNDAYEKVQGNNPDGTPNPTYENLIDVDNLIDYMLVILWGGNLDAPISNFLGNTSPNNFFAVRDRTDQHGGFRFMAHDSEHTLLDVNASRIGPFPAGSSGNGGGLAKSNPQYFWQQMWGNAEFKLRVADHAQKHLFNRGALTAPSALSRFLTRSNEISQAINAESARWGNANHSPSYTRATWLSTMRFVTGTFIPQRGPVVVSQLRSKGLFPATSAPVLSPFGGLVPPGFGLFLTNLNVGGTVYYTLDGSDPRLRGGAVASTALTYTPGTPIPINYETSLRARVLNGSVWSAIIEPTFYVAQDFSKLLVTEIMFDPPAVGAISGDAFEFLELKNTGTSLLDLSGLSFTAGITFTFPNGSRLEPGKFYVLGRDATALTSKYPGLTVDGIYTGKLGNGGEQITLSHLLSGTLFSFNYAKDGIWPSAPAGLGFSLVPRNPDNNPDPSNPLNWRASTYPGGSPGADDPPPDRDGDRMPDAWEARYGLNPDDPADASLDIDNDGMSNLAEYLAGTDPRNPASSLKIDGFLSGKDMITIQFSAVSNRSYTVEYRDSLAASTPWQNWTNIAASPANRLLLLTNSTIDVSRRYYRLSVHGPP